MQLKSSSQLGYYLVITLVALVALVFLSSSCSSIPASNRTTPVAITTDDIKTATNVIPSKTVEIPSPEPTIPFATSQASIPSSEDQISQLNTPAPDPLRFSFPAAAPPPVSAWRPPLYPTPWVPTDFDHFYFSRPIAADEINWPLADYRYGGVFIPEVVHTGIDIPAGIGTQVLAAGSGRVNWTGYGLYRGVEDPTDPYGLAVVIKHDFGFQGETLFTVYGHLSQIDVTLGQQVQTGNLIGLVGQTGKVTGPHLHFEVRLGRNNFFRSRNPELWLAPPQGWGVLVARVMNTSGQPLQGQTISVRSKEDNQHWSVNTYTQGAVVSDVYYQENMVLGDLPAGKYEVWIPFAGSTYNLDIEIKPGMISYFTFKGRNGFKTELPATPHLEFTPPSPISSHIP